MSAQDRARLLVLLNTPGLTNLPVKNVTSGELTLIAEGPGALDRTRVLIDGGETRNLLEDAPQSWWINSSTLLDAVEKNWLDVLDPNAGVFIPSSVLTAETIQYIVAPKNPGIGDLLVWDGVAWVLFSPGTSGYVLTSNGPGVEPSYQPVAGGGGAGDGLTVTGQTTTGLTDGDLCYISGNNTWLRARSDGTRQQATLRGAFTGTAGTMVFSGRVASAKFTTVGGAPIPGEEVYLAAQTDDGGNGLGKLTATQPITGFLTVAGICLDATSYAGLKTAIVLLKPQSPIAL